ncbi:class II aldolase/adducin family protein [bacterium]|nr:class II aldolase/adducin family protein [bacterium]MBU1637654.1 class II aldolase/adducin family protein [bacterium]MBU1920685.1 class II aldolase/adducin family protein [bacterium]
MPVMEELLRAAKVLADFDCLPATDGNFSARLARQQILITRSGIEKRTLTEAGFVTADLSDESPAGVSSEWPMHKIIYLGRSDVNCILHVHSPGLTAFAAAHKLPDMSILTEAAMAIGEIALVPYAQPGSEEMGLKLLDASSTASVYLLSNHGALSVGGTVTEALHRLERAEFLARVELSAAAIGGGVPLPQQDLKGLIP